MKCYLIINVTVAALVGCAVLTVNSHPAVGTDCDDAKTTKDIVDCQDLQLKKATQSLSTLHQQLNRVLTVEQRQALQKAHTAWLSYREAHCDSATSLYQGGTMETVMSVTCFAEMTKERVKQLQATFELMLKSPKQSKKRGRESFS